MYWITKDNRKINIKNMTTEHIYNTLVVLTKKHIEIKELTKNYKGKVPPYRIHKYAISTWIKRFNKELSLR